LGWIWLRHPACFNVDSPSALRRTAIGKGITAGVVGVERFFKYGRVCNGGMRDVDSANELVALVVDAFMQLVAEVILYRASLVHLERRASARALWTFQVVGIAPSLTVSASSRLLHFTLACTSEAGSADIVDHGSEVDMLGQADQRIAQLRALISPFLFGNWAGLGHPHRWDSSFVWNQNFTDASAMLGCPRVYDVGLL
jgi:hypothetical protein